MNFLLCFSIPPLNKTLIRPPFQTGPVCRAKKSSNFVCLNIRLKDDENGNGKQYEANNYSTS